ncbi:hypothetical protein EBESD8_35400 [Rhodococcus aetherivorans]|nr:hypothetical protein EBESD8_35400 [Rhodococcus aetherivorans]
MHPVAGRGPGELGGPHPGLAAEGAATIRVGEQVGDGVGELVRGVDEHAGDAVDDRVGQSPRAAVADGGHAVLRGLDDGQPPALLARRHHVHPGPGEQFVLAVLGDVAVEGDGIGDAEVRGGRAQVPLPPAAADDVEVQAGDAVAQRGDGGEGVLDLLVRHEPRQHAHGGVRGAGVFVAGLDPGGDGVGAVADDGDAVTVDAEGHQFVGGRQRHGQVLVVAVQARRQGGLDPPAEPGHDAAGDGPLLTVAVVHEHGHGRAGDEAGEERDAVLGVDHRVGPEVAQRTESETAGGDRGEGAGVDGEPAAAAADGDAVDLVAAGGAGVGGGAEGDADAARGELGADLFEVAFAAPTLGMPGVAPAQQQNLAHVATPCGSSSTVVSRNTLTGAGPPAVEGYRRVVRCGGRYGCSSWLFRPCPSPRWLEPSPGARPCAGPSGCSATSGTSSPPPSCSTGRSRATPWN